MVLWLTENMSLVKLHVLLLSFASLGYVRVLFPTSGADSQILTRSIFPCWDPHTPGISRHGTPPKKNGKLVYVFCCLMCIFVVLSFSTSLDLLAQKLCCSSPWRVGGVPGFKATSVFFAMAIILESIVIGPARHGETTVQGTNPCKLKNYVKRNISQNNHWLDS